MRVIFFLSLFLALTAGCSEAPTEESVLRQDYANLEQAARGTEVRWHMWGGSAQINQWVDTYVAGEMKRLHDISVVRVPMDAPVFVNKLLTEKAAGKTTGTMDLLWINGENFKNAMQSGVLFGPFTDRLPSFTAWYDPQKSAHDFGFPVNGFEAPYGRAQFVFEYDTERTPTPPATLVELADWIRANPGRFTYPQPPQFHGTSFLKQLLLTMHSDRARFQRPAGADFDTLTRPLWQWLDAAHPLMWRQGRSLPASGPAQRRLKAEQRNAGSPNVAHDLADGGALLEHRLAQKG